MSDDDWKKHPNLNAATMEFAYTVHGVQGGSWYVHGSGQFAPAWPQMTPEQRKEAERSGALRAWFDGCLVQEEARNAQKAEDDRLDHEARVKRWEEHNKPILERQEAHERRMAEELDRKRRVEDEREAAERKERHEALREYRRQQAEKYKHGTVTVEETPGGGTGYVAGAGG